MKLYFYYGVMNSSKTANALMKKFNFEECGRKVALMKPSLDTRYGKTLVKSRIGLSSEAFLLDQSATILETLGENHGFEVIIIDEAQFLTKKHVDELREIANSGIMVMCYGLKTDYTGHLFEGSKRLTEISDTIREIQSMCAKCHTKAITNARHVNGKIVFTAEGGNVIDLGGEDKYIALCNKCWKKGVI